MKASKRTGIASTVTASFASIAASLALTLILSSTLALITPDQASAQLARERANPNPPVSLTFMAPKHINLYTTEALAAGELHYSIMHTFGEVRSGIEDLWGMDNGANIRLSIEYGFTDRLSAGFGRASTGKMIDLYARYALVRQTTSGSTPVSVSLVPTLGITTTSLDFVEPSYDLRDRLNFGLSLPVSRKMNDRLSLLISPMIAHFNRVGTELPVADGTVNTYATVALGGRYKISPSTALSLQTLPALTDSEPLKPNFALGIDIETGGHVFQIFFTTSEALNDPYLLAGRNGNLLDREFRIGFNVNRLFRIGG